MGYIGKVGFPLKRLLSYMEILILRYVKNATKSISEIVELETLKRFTIT